MQFKHFQGINSFSPDIPTKKTLAILPQHFASNVQPELNVESLCLFVSLWVPLILQTENYRGCQLNK